MKKIITSEVECCDFCPHECSSYQCRLCKRWACWQCSSKIGRKYESHLHFSTSKDGFYCLDCNAQLILSPTPLFRAYRRLESLKNEYKVWLVEIKERADKVEEEIDRLCERV